MSATTTRGLASREIQRHFGNLSRDPGRWLKHKLLTCVNDYYQWGERGAICKKYKLNLEGYNEVCQLLGYAPKYQITQELEQQFASGDFEYDVKSDRIFTPAQYIPKEVRREIAENHYYTYHYDICAAAPTLLLQQAHKLYRTLNKKRSLVTQNLQNYVDDRATVRKQIADECQTSEANVKFLINALIQGGRLTARFDNKTFVTLNYDYALFRRLQANPTLCGIRKDIKKVWEVINLVDPLPVGYLIDKNGKQRRRALTGKDKSGYYRSLENLVGIKCIKKYLEKDNNRHLWLHDGWSCNKPVDDVELIAEVKRQTGFVIKLDRELFGNN